MLAIDPTKDRKEIVARVDKGRKPEEQTIFVCRPLSVYEDAAVNDLTRFGKSGELQLNTQQKNVLAFRLGLVEVRNLQGPEGKEVKLEREETPWGLAASEGFLSRVPPKVVKEIGEAIRDMSSPSEDELGN